MTLYMSSVLDIIYMTKHQDSATPEGRDRLVEIEITEEMIRAGGWALIGEYDPCDGDSPYDAAKIVLQAAAQAARRQT